MPGLHVAIHALPQATTPGPIRTMEGRAIRTLTLPPAVDCPFPRSFEEVQIDLDSLPRMFFEPDGSFVWTGGDPQDPWQLDGVVYDRKGRVQVVELRGSCPQSQLDILLRSLGWPAAKIVVQLLGHGVFIEEAEFRRVLYAGES